MPDANGFKFINSVLAGIEGIAPATSSGLSKGDGTERESTQPGDISITSDLKRKASQAIRGEEPKAPRRDAKLNQAPSSDAMLTPTSITKFAPRLAPSSPSTDSIPKAAPRKGTFAETLARAKAAQAATNHIGVIKHKPIERLSIKERRALKEQRRAKAPSSKSSRPARTDGEGRRRLVEAANGSDGQRSSGVASKASGSKTTSGSKKPEQEHKGTSRPARETGYKGTARPIRTETEYRGTARPSGVNSPQSTGRKNVQNLSNRPPLKPRPSRRPYQAPSESEKDEDEEEQEADGMSDGSSDMEAAAFEVEEEEFTSLKTARKEDEEALRQELELKKKKQERKRLLQALAAKRR